MTPPLFVPALGRSLYPGASVALDFTRNLYRSGTPVVKGSPSLLSGWTFTRASTGYAETAAGALVAFASGAPRITDKGLLVEEARTNLLLRSQEFDNASWTKTNLTITANAITAPDGTLTADKLEVATTASTQALQTVTAFASTSGVMTIYGKIGSGATDANRFVFYNSTTATSLLSITINWTTGVITHVTGSGATSQQMADGWWRIIMPVTSGITSGDNVRMYAVGMGASETAGEFCYLWGAQLEAGAFATSYIPTTTASATRAADVATITGLSIPAPFTVLLRALTPTTAAGNSRRFTIAKDLGTAERVIFINTASTGMRTLGTAASGTVYAPTETVLTVDAALGIAASHNGTSWRSALNGVDKGTSAAAAPTGMNSMMVGLGDASTSQWNNYIKQVVVYPYAMTTAQLQAATA